MVLSSPLAFLSDHPAFALMAHMLQAITPDRFVCALEGGYDLVTTANCVEAVVRVLLVLLPLPFLCDNNFIIQGENPPAYKHSLPSAPAMIDILSCIAFQKEHWKCIAALDVPSLSFLPPTAYSKNDDLWKEVLAQTKDAVANYTPPPSEPQCAQQ